MSDVERHHRDPPPTAATAGLAWVPETGVLVARGASVLALHAAVRRLLALVVAGAPSPDRGWLMDLLHHLDEAAADTRASAAKASARGSAEAVARGVPSRSQHDDLTTTDAGARLGTTPRRVGQIAAAGRFPGAWKTPRGEWRIPLEDLVDYRRQRGDQP